MGVYHHKIRQYDSRLEDQQAGKAGGGRVAGGQRRAGRDGLEQ